MYPHRIFQYHWSKLLFARTGLSEFVFFVRNIGGTFVQAAEAFFVEVFHVEVLVAVEAFVQVERTAGSRHFLQSQWFVWELPRLSWCISLRSYSCR